MICNVVGMGNVQVRISNEMLGEIDRLSKMLESSRSEVIRKALDDGIIHIKMETTLRDYIDNKITLCKAAVLAGTSVMEFADYAAERGIPFMRYGAEEAEEDLLRLRKRHESAD
jgi:predicted HTH domain antitoxin